MEVSLNQSRVLRQLVLIVVVGALLVALILWALLSGQ
jgi:hypothetical protein